MGIPAGDGLLYASMDEMISQMLGRRKYTHEQIAAFMKTTVAHIEKVESWRHNEIEKTYTEYVACLAILERVTGGVKCEDEDAGFVRIAHTMFNGHRNRMSPAMMWDGTEI